MRSTTSVWARSVTNHHFFAYVPKKKKKKCNAGGITGQIDNKNAKIKDDQQQMFLVFHYVELTLLEQQA